REAAGCELIDQRQCEREAGRRTTDLLRVDLDRERRVADRRRVERDEADDRPVRIVLRRDELDVAALNATDTGAAELDAPRVTVLVHLERVDEIVDDLDLFSIDLDEFVVLLENVSRRRVPVDARALFVPLRAQVVDDHRPRLEIDRKAELR